MKNIIFTFILICTLFSSQNLHSSGWGKGHYINGLGFTFDYVSYNDNNDIGAYITYRKGVVYYYSFFLTADIGYRFKENNPQGRFGVQAMIALWGIETGMVSAIADNTYYPGIYIGLAGVYPTNDYALFYSIGGNIYTNSHSNELYFSVTFLFNFFAGN